MLKRIVIIFLFLIFLILPTRLVIAQTSFQGDIPSSSNYKAPQQSTFIVDNLSNSVICLIIGRSSPTGSYGECPSTTATGLKLFSQVPGGGALGTTSLAFSSMYMNPPVSTDLYLAQLESTLRISNAYAQAPLSVPGSGSTILSVILNLWTLARNITYLLFILIIVIVGFMIMFRHKINPQTVVTVQMALPRLVIGIILVTFSYLIASLIVDLSFVGAGFVGLFFTSSYPNDTGVQSLSSAGNIPGIFTLFFFRTGIITSSIWGFANLFSGWMPVTLQQVSGPTTPDIMGWIADKGLALMGGAVGGVVGTLVIAVVLIAALIQCLRLVWGLLQCYISIFVFTILGPFIILFSSLPGQEKALGFWWRNILGNVLAFPAVFAAFLFAGAILNSLNTPNCNYLVTGQCSAAALPLFGGMDTSLLKSMIAVGIVLGTPAIPRMVRDAVGAKGLGAIAGEASRGLGNAATVGGILGVGAATNPVIREVAQQQVLPRILRNRPIGRAGI